MSALAIGAGAAVLGTGFKLYEGIKQDNEANQIKKNLKQPNYAIPDEFIQNRNIAKQLAQVGLPQQQYNNQFNQINSNTATGIAAAQRSNNPSAIGGVISGANAAGANLNAEDAQARQNNQRVFMQANEQLGGQKIAQQQSNIFDPYTQKYNEMQADKGAGLQNLNSSFGDIGQLGGLAMQYGLGQQNTPQTQQPSNFDSRVLNPQLSGSNTMTGYQMPQLPTQLPGNNQNFLPQQNVPYGTGWHIFQ